MLNVWRRKTVRLWAILKQLAMVAKASNAHLATSGHVWQQKNLFVPITVLNMHVQGQDIPVAAGTVAAGNIKNVHAKAAINGAVQLAPKNPVLRPTNIPVLAPATPVAQALPAVASILNAYVQAAMNGKMGVVKSP